MSTMPSTHPLIYQSVIVGGKESPGVVTLSGHSRKHKWERQRPKGTAGEFSVNQGKDLIAFSASFFLADLDDVTAWDEFAKMLATTLDGPKPTALSVFHPDLVRQQVTDVVVEDLGPLQYDAKGGATVVVKFLEYRPPKAKPASKAQAKTRTGTTTLDPNAAAKRELAALLEQAKTP